MLARAEEIKQPKRREVLTGHKEQILLSRTLVTLDDRTPLDFGLDDLEVKDPDPEVLIGFLTRMEFRTITKRIADKLGVAQPAILDETPGGAAPVAEEGPKAVPFDHAAYEAVRDRAALEVWVARIRERGWVAVDTETTSLDEMQADLVGISLCVEAGQACYIPVGHRAGDDLFGGSARAEGQMTADEALAVLKPVLEDASILKIGQNMKYDWKIFRRYGVEVGPVEDTMLMSYAMNAGLHAHGMDELSERYLGHVPIPIKSLLGRGRRRSRSTGCRWRRR